MEGAARARTLYSKNLCQRLAATLTFNSKSLAYFQGKYLSVRKATEPSIILWENLGASQKVRAVRGLITTIVALFLIFICLLINTYG